MGQAHAFLVRSPFSDIFYVWRISFGAPCFSRAMLVFNFAFPLLKLTRERYKNEKLWKFFEIHHLLLALRIAPTT
jgi:hypothetical protein